MRIFVIICFIFVSMFSFSQTEKVYNIVEEYAEFIGGPKALKEFLTDNLKFPETSQNEGVVYLKFVVSHEGVISNVKVTKGIEECPECSIEAIRVFMLMSDWKPAKINGKNVSSYFNSKVKFQMTSK